MITPSFSPTATERVLPKLALDFTTASLDPRVTFTRATSASNPATYVASTGYVTNATNNQPRFDYNPVTLACKGLLIEESRSNSILYSDDLSNAFWNRWQCSVTQNATTSPSNTLTAGKLYSNSGQVGNLYKGITLTAASYTISIYAKPAGFSWLLLGAATAGNSGVWFNVSSGVVGTQNAGYTGKIENAGNGWYRCSVTFTATAANWNVIVFSTNQDNVLSVGNGADGTYLWGAQLEAGAFATSYIPTTTTALTRNADVATMTGTNFSSWFNASEGAFVAEIQQDTNRNYSGTYRHIYRVLPASGSASSISALVNTSNQFQAQFADSSSSQASMSVGSNTGTISKFATAYKINSFAAAAQGGATSTDSSGSVPSSLTQIILGSIEGTGAPGCLDGYLRKFFYYPQRLTNAEVQAFSK